MKTLRSRHWIGNRRASSSSLAILALLTLGMSALVPAKADLLYQRVRVSDTGLTQNSIAQTGTSKKLALGADGTIYAAFYGPSGIRIARSTDRGQSFGPSVQISPNNVEPSITVSSTGTVYVAWVFNAMVMTSRSVDGGNTYSSPMQSGAATSGNSLSVQIATDANYVYIVDREAGRLIRSVDGGASFGAVLLGPNAVYSDVHVDPDNGNVVVRVDDPMVKYYESTDHGAHFSPVIMPVPNQELFTPTSSLSVGSARRFLVVSGLDRVVHQPAVYRINLQTRSADIIHRPPTNSLASMRPIATDRHQNMVDAFFHMGQLQFQVSNDLGTSYGGTTTVATANEGEEHASVLVNPLNGDVLFLHTQGGEIFLTTFENELPGYVPVLSARSLDLGTMLVGASTGARSVTVTNSAPVAIQVTSIMATGDFEHTSDCIGTLAAGASCTVSATMMPTGLGVRSGQLLINTNASLEPRVVELVGTGTNSGALAVFIQTEVNFGALPMGDTGTVVVPLVNIGSDALSIQSMDVAGADFSATHDCPITLAPKHDCDVTISYAPHAAGPSTGTLTLQSNATGTPASITLTGTAVAPPPQFTVTTQVSQGQGTITPSSVDVFQGHTAQFTVTAASGYRTESVSGCNGSFSGDTFTTGEIVAACSVTASFVAVGSTPQQPTFTPAQLPPINLNARSLRTTLPADLTAPTAVDAEGNPLAVTLVDPPATFGPGAHQLMWRAVDAQGVTAMAVQTINVMPTVTLSRDTTLAARTGAIGEFRISLNGHSPIYPFTVPYTVSGDASGTSLASGVVVFHEGDVERVVPIEVTEGGSDRQLTVTLDPSLNVGDNRSLTVSLSTGPVPGRIDILGQQEGQFRPVFNRDGGLISFTPTIVGGSGLNEPQTIQWTDENGGIIPTENGVLVIPPPPDPDREIVQYIARMSSQDSEIMVRMLEVLIPLAPPPETVVSWAFSGLPKDPRYSPAIPNVLPQRRGQLDSYLIEADAGLQLALGADASLRNGWQSEIAVDGSGGIPIDTVPNVGGYFDFTISRIPPGESIVNIVLPQREAIPANPVYRKYSRTANRWVSFVTNATQWPQQPVRQDSARLPRATNISRA